MPKSMIKTISSTLQEKVMMGTKINLTNLKKAHARV